MSGKPVRLDPEADRDAAEAARWYESRCAGLGADFLEAVARALEELERRDPESYPPAPEGPPGDTPFRLARVQGFPYRIVFAERPLEVRAYAVAHDAREPYWRGRLG